MKFHFSHLAEKQFHKLSPEIQKEIVKKLQEYKISPELFLLHLKTVKNFHPCSHRLRISDHRLLLEKLNDNDWLVLKIGHRKNIYSKKL
jgi:mRNA-degrading endonuclease RelE of RelBE toxin-antitoxin system